MIRMSAKKQQRGQALTPGKSGYISTMTTMRTPNTAPKRKLQMFQTNTDKKAKLALFDKSKGEFLN